MNGHEDPPEPPQPEIALFFLVLFQFFSKGCQIFDPVSSAADVAAHPGALRLSDAPPAQTAQISAQAQRLLGSPSVSRGAQLDFSCCCSSFNSSSTLRPPDSIICSTFCLRLLHLLLLLIVSSPADLSLHRCFYPPWERFPRPRSRSARCDPSSLARGENPRPLTEASAWVCGSASLTSPASAHRRELGSTAGARR